jgi:hypothetical protein
MHSYILNILSGALAGLLCALGGALKDSPYEGFSPYKLLRSPLVGTFWGVVSCTFTADVLFAFVFSGYMERIAVEGYKILRAKRPGKFQLPHPSMLGARLSFNRSPEFVSSGGRR